MSKIPKRGSIPLYFLVEESMPHSPGWRPLNSGSLSQLDALVQLDQLVTSSTLRVVQVVAVRLPGESGFWTSPARAIAKALAPLVAGDPEYAGDRYAEDFPRPRGVTP